jgi:EAL domain-containing protein (putative c-di-GMP-specific phosphodiesterase class I)
MPHRFRALIVSDNDDFRAELVDLAESLNLSVKAIAVAPELPTALEAHGFDWAIVDLDMGSQAAQQLVDGLGRTRARLVFIGENEIVLAAARRAAGRVGLDVAGALGRPFSFAALAEAVERQIGDASNPAPVPDPLFGDRPSIPEHEVEIHYQPMISIEDRMIRGMEALVRWNHPEHGLLGPSRFIALAEHNGAIVPLTWTVLGKVVRQQVAWRKEGMLLAVSVNISALFLASLQTADDMLSLLDDEGFDPRHLTLEITESEAARNPPVANALLRRLRTAGIAVSMDDYGMGFSNLQRLRLFPFSDLKIDRWLVGALGRSAEARQTIEMLASLANRENFTLTGEGIETEEQLHALRELGCHFGQGYLIAHPMPGDLVRAWVSEARQSGRYQSLDPV